MRDSLDFSVVLSFPDMLFDAKLWGYKFIALCSLKPAPFVLFIHSLWYFFLLIQWYSFDIRGRQNKIAF